MTKNNETNEVIAAILIGCAGVYMVFGMPFFVGGMLSELSFNQSDANLVSSAEISGMSLSSLLGIIWVGKYNWRIVARLALLAIIIGNIISCYISDFNTLLTVRFLTGLLGHGTAFALGVAAIGATSEPDKNFGFSVASQVIMGSLTALFIPQAIAKYGLTGMCAPAILLGIIALFFTSNLAVSTGKKTASKLTSNRLLILPILALIIMVVWQMGVGPFFNNLVPYGISMNLAADDVGRALFLSTALSIIGPLSASALASRINKNVAICCALTTQVIIILSFQGEITWVGFALRVILFQTAWNFVGPFLMGLIASVDESGNYSVLIPASQLGGIAIGHGIIASLIQGNNMGLINYYCAAVIFLSAFLYILVAGKLKQSSF
ncbi:MAG: hypothetical protein P8M55_00560 [Gammaproteobacteria bacterium]|nr:hypothetical protein [Gammaproteobacteria bacterium]